MSANERDKFLREEVKRQRKARGMPLLTEEDLREPFERLMRTVPFDGPYSGTQRERALLRQFTSTLISQYIGAMHHTASGWGSKAVNVEQWARTEVETLKGLTWYYVIDSQALASLRSGQRQVIRTLFEIYASAAFSSRKREQRILPEFFQEELNEARSDSQKLRIVADVIASMSEAQALETYQRLTGLSLGSALAKPPA